ncbi:MAG: acyltransferase [Chloroflexota bacterium]
MSGGPAFGWLGSLAGLRGVAILLVLAFHLGLPVAGGGSVGVTAFFVLSGFLITSLLVAESTATGSVDLTSFYRRRIRRLFPALFATVGVVTLIALVAGQLEAITLDSILAITYVANWARATGQLMGVWNHTWSLAIEEQFYLVWPLAFVALRRLAPATSLRVIATLLGIAIASAIWRIILNANAASDARVYFGSDTRAEALLAGCALACAVARWPSVRIPRWAGTAALLTLLAVAANPNIAAPWPGAMYSIATAATCLVIIAGLRPGRQWLGLDTRPMKWLGERSYSLYLWHVPVILFLGAPMGQLAPAVRIGALAMFSLALAILSYELVERPLRRPRTAACGVAPVIHDPVGGRLVRIRARLAG